MRKTLLWLPALLLAGVLAALALGFVRFVDSLSRLPNPDMSGVEAIVVLTGGGGRLRAGLDALAAMPHARLFVSGVNRQADVGRLIEQLRPEPDFPHDRISVGVAATNTRGNARETARWMAEEGLTRLALVTAAYHMPRAEAEFRRAMPDVALVPYPVFPPNVPLNSWWRYWGTTRLLVVEYAKFRFAHMRP